MKIGDQVIVVSNLTGYNTEYKEGVVEGIDDGYVEVRIKKSKVYDKRHVFPITAKNELFEIMSRRTKAFETYAATLQELLDLNYDAYL